ncbi:putative leucine-rich repeat-containing protein DDB_G0290503 isoform X4 [Tenebrio molitor]|uniref:putative leucine-rich repeat-containing protein DDB_G0290503 isoform X4 n=1 Tax=Tenebrio molitor TaxID=7067 RepID=UPI0036247557
MYRRKEHRAFQVVQILKKNIMDETPDSDGNSNQFEPAQNTTHTKTKKSLFATLIKRKHAKMPKVKITKKIETCSTINFDTESASSEQELAHYQLSSESEKLWPKQEVVQSSTQTRKTKHYNFFQKIIKRSKMEEFPKKTSSGLPAANNGCGEPQNSERKLTTKALAQMNNVVPTTYMPKYNIKLINGINELQDILQNLSHCEDHMIYLLKKYIEDKSFQKQLLDASSEYFALQYDSKCQANVLADRLWCQQLEVAKIQDYNIQKRLNFLVKTNRSLQFQIESLCRHCEKLASRTNLYPKRFLHMRSFGKIYARQLIDNNRKLQNKIKALTGVITDFEEELQKSQHQKAALEDEKRGLKSQIYRLENVLDKQEADREMENSTMMMQLGHQNNLIKDSEEAIRYICQDLHSFEHQIRELAINVNWSTFQHQGACLPEMIYQIRVCIGEIFVTMVAAYRNVTIIAKDVTKLRNTNARLQENLQKSTNELDNLSKKLDRNAGEGEINTLQSHCEKLEQENFSLKLKLDSAFEQNKFLREEIENKNKMLNESKTSVNDFSTQHQMLSNQLDEIVQMISQLGPNDLSKEFPTSQEKLEYLKLRYGQVVSDRKHLVERCSSLEDENQNLVQAQQIYQQDLATLQDGVTILAAENETVKKQLSTEHQTVTSLQNERIKYLEEKNILKTIFQHLKSEISRIQQLEGAVADMTKETSRLSLIAEFNKQLGEQLKNEVEVKDNTILELRQSLEKLSHIQIDSDKEKMTLCAQLSEVASVKEKLSDCLEMELKKNLHLDESKKKLETSTKSQLKIFEEMQKNERTALKELLKDFKSLIKQRDCLVHMQEQQNKKYRDLEKYCHEVKKQYEGALVQVNNRDKEIRRLVEKLEEQEMQMRQVEGESNANTNKYEKNLRKLEKLLGQIRSENNELEASNNYLKTNLQNMQNDLNEAKEKESMMENKLTVKTAEYATLESEVNNYRNDLQAVSQENGKMKLEMEYLKKLYDQQTSELKDTISMYSSKDNVYMETQTTMLNKEQQIGELNKIIFEKENDIKQIQQECTFLKKQNEDLNKILMGYENQLVVLQDVETSKLKLEKEFHNVQLEHKTTLGNLESAQKEIENLKHELKEQIAMSEDEKSFYKSQTTEIIWYALNEYSEQKANIEDEIDSISTQLRMVTENLHKEKLRFEELTKCHEELDKRYLEMNEKFNSEADRHKDACRKIENMENLMKVMGSERDNLQQQVHMLLLEINEEKESNIHIHGENQKMQMILEQGRQQYAAVLDRNAALEDELKELHFEMKMLMNSKDSSQNEIEKTLMNLEEKSGELKSAKETVECLRKELGESQKTVFDLKEDYFKLQQHVTGLEFKNCELTLQLHEIQGKLATERNLYQDLKHNKNRESTSASAPSDCGELFF